MYNRPDPSPDSVPEPSSCLSGAPAAGSRWHEGALAFGLFPALSAIFTYPLVLHLADAVEDGQDALLNVWILAWDGHALLTDPLRLFDANIFYPFTRTLAYSEINLSQALLALPATLVSGNPVLGYNVALLLTFVLSGWGMYLLARRLTGSRWAGLGAGIVFAFNAYKLSNLAQIQLSRSTGCPSPCCSWTGCCAPPEPRHPAPSRLLGRHPGHCRLPRPAGPGQLLLRPLRGAGRGAVRGLPFRRRPAR